MQSMEAGNPLDEAVTLFLLLGSLTVVLYRSFNWRQFFRQNVALATYVGFALISACWSDFPLIAMKRWFRDLGAYFIVLVILSDPRPTEALKWVLRRLCYLAIPLSIVLDKYFPDTSRIFDPWTGTGQFSGITTGKNLLGCLALIAALFFFWDILDRWSQRRQKRTKAVLILNCVFLAMSFSLLQTAQSTTAMVCCGLGSLAIAAVHSKMLRRNPKVLKVLFPATFLVYLIVAFGLHLNGSLAQEVGKSPTLTDRTKIWSFVLSMHTNPIVGTGYESFWVGPRLEWFWNNAGLGHLNEAHNGYLEVYLQLGIIGVLLIAWILVSGYRNICRRLSPYSAIAPFAFAFWTAMLFYSETEAGFRSGMMWAVLLLVSLSVPQRLTRREYPVPRKRGWQPEEHRQPEVVLRLDWPSPAGEAEFQASTLNGRK